jgi:hypothetical protein
MEGRKIIISEQWVKIYKLLKLVLEGRVILMDAA